MGYDGEVPMSAALLAHTAGYWAHGTAHWVLVTVLILAFVLYAAIAFGSGNGGSS